MKIYVKKSLLIIITILCLFILFSACESKNDDLNNAYSVITNGDIVDDNDVDDNADDNVDDEFLPILRFAVISDIHTRATSDKLSTADEIDCAKLRTERLFSSTYKYANGEAYTDVDAVIIAGDYTDDGEISQYNAFFNAVNDNIQDGTKLLACLGNHEFHDTSESGSNNNTKFTSTYSRFESYFGYGADSVNIINGYYFIGISPDANGGRGISTAKGEWLKNQLEIAVASDETKQKPIFVFSHLPSSQTTLGSFLTYGGNDTYKVQPLDDVLINYPQVVLMAGHTHTPANDPESIYQGNFTALNTGTFAYGDYPINMGNGSSITNGIQLDACGGYQNKMADKYNEHGDKESCVYTIIELAQNNNLRIRYYNADADCFIGEPVLITSIGNVDEFVSYEDRRIDSVVPEFNDSLTLNYVSANSLIVNIPNAVCKDYVRNYKVDLYLGNALQKTIYRLACQNQLPLPINITASFSELMPDTEYTIKVYAYNGYGKISKDISLTVKTLTAESRLSPDVFSLKVDSDGNVSDGVSGTNLKITGTANTTFSEDLGKNVTAFDGTGSYDYYGIKNYYDVLTSGFTLEIVGKVDGVPTQSYVDLFSCQQDGGFGFEYSNNGKLYIYIYVLKSDKSGGYQRVGVTIPVNEYFHLVATYEGNTIKLYYNGTLADQLAVAGSVWFPIKDSARYIAVGGDSDLYGESSGFMSGEIAVANVYSAVLDSYEVSAKYQALGLN